jgi:hypothetical protein
VTTIRGAIVKEQGITFAIAVVKSYVLQTQMQASDVAMGLERYFPGLPLVLMAQDTRGKPTYFGRKDIVNFLASIDVSRIPWQRFTFH